MISADRRNLWVRLGAFIALQMEDLTNIIIEKRTRAHFSDATGGPIQSRIVGRAWDEVILQMMIAAWKERRLPIANPVTENRAFPVLLSGSADHASARHLISLSGLPSCVIDSGSFLINLAISPILGILALIPVQIQLGVLVIVSRLRWFGIGRL
ncbi:hypothetical protein An02g01030 [Aspergillus niger]|uniref:Uncharacterized protein n=2 Tax=Aspergillus niger TaxID=5061 RepID=A2QBS2_ASPNC|nr:hypothetical protein An02g01030 [Aspergillus niger]CAK96319.1 hypothetical protein An02g01030 [Aspergillus niger]